MIKKLKEDISTRIAAGEVIERPVSVAKELLENSLDAGATSVTIRTLDGGKLSFVIEDNGCGMSFDELPLAIERYATSKISTLDDLENISTLGYRGEALASVAAISKIEIITRQEGSDEGSILKAIAGQISLHKKTSAPKGTRIQIDDMFFNLPARRKFLKAGTAELRRIASVVNDYALLHYDKTFRLYEGTKKILEYFPVKTQEEALFRRIGEETKVYSADFSFANIKVKMWYNPLPDSKKVVLNLFVLGRRVQDAGVRAAITTAGVGNGEWLVLIECNARDIDVNVHPTKEEIRFRRSGDVFKAVYTCAKHIFARRHAMEGLGAAEEISPKIETLASQIETRDSDKQFFVSNAPNFDYSNSGWQVTHKTKPGEQQSKAENTKSYATFESETKLELDDKEASTSKKFLGQLSSGFLVFDFPHSMAIMDPHAAHERILFEQICSDFKDGVKTQNLTIPQIMPETVATNAKLYGAELARLGFLTKNEAIVAVPVIRGKGHMSPVEMLRSTIAGIESEQDPTKRDREVWWRMARMACRDAVKLGQKFLEDEALELLAKLEQCENPFTCPHGRPTLLIFEEEKLRGWFER